MGKVSTIGLDIAKSVFQVHGVDDAGAVVIRKRISRSKVLEFFAALRRVWLGLKLVHPRITGAADCKRWVTRCG
jgi:transposase